MNKIGIAGTFWQDTFAEQQKLADKFSKGTVDYFNAMIASSEDLEKAKGLPKYADNIKRVSEETKKLTQQNVGEAIKKAYADVEKWLFEGWVDYYREVAKVQEEFTDEWKRLKLTEYEYEQDQLTRQYEYFKQYLGDSLELQEWYVERSKQIFSEIVDSQKEEIKKAYRKLEAELMPAITEMETEIEKTFGEGIQAGLDKYLESVKKTFKAGEDLAYDFATEIEYTLTKMFDDPKQALDDLLDYFKYILSKIVAQAMMTQVLIPVTATAATSSGLTGTGTTSSSLTSIPGMMLGSYSSYESFMMGLEGLSDTAFNAISEFAYYLPYIGAAAMTIYGITAGDPAMIGTGIGAAIGTAILPGIGTILGSLLGNLVGSLFGGEEAPPDFGLALWSNYPGAWGTTEPGYMTAEEREAYLSQGGFGFATFGDLELAIGESAMSQIANFFEDFSNLVQDQMEELGLSVAGFGQQWSAAIDDIESMTEEEIQALIQGWIGDYTEFVTGIDFSQWQKEGEEITDTIVRVLSALESIPKTLESFDDYIDAIMDNYDEIAGYKDALREANEQILQLKEALISATDPTDAEEYANALKDAIYELYTTQRDMVEGLVQAIEDAERGMTDFGISMQQRIDELLGTSGSTALIEAAMAAALSGMQQAGTPEEQLEYLDLYLTYLDDLYSAIENQYNSQIDAINDVIDGLNEQKDIIDEQIDALRTQLDLVERWQDILDSTGDMITDLTFSSSNPADVYERLGLARTEIQNMMGLYQGAAGEERAGYASELLTLISDYLGLAQEAYQRPSGEYQSIYDETLGWLRMIQQDAETQAASGEDLLQQIADLESQSAEIDAQIVSYQKQITEIETLMEAELSAFRQEAAQYYQWAMTTGLQLYQSQIDELQGYLGEIIGDHTPEEYIAELQQETILQLEEIRDILQVWYDNFMADIQSQQQAAGLVPGVPTAGGYTTEQMQDLLSWYQAYYGGIEYSLESLVADFNANTQAWLDWLPTVGYAFPSYQHGGYVDSTGLAYLHAGETVIPSQRNDYATTITIAPQITINASGDASPHDIAIAVEDIVVDSVNNGRIGRAVKEKVRYG